MVIQDHIKTMCKRMLAVDTNSKYMNLLLNIVNQKAKKQINKDDMILSSAAEHCGIFNSYNTISNSLTFLYEYSKIKTNKRKYFIIFSGSLVPLDNADYPRGIFYNETFSKLGKIPLWEERIRKSFPLILPAATTEKIPTQKYLFNQEKVFIKIKDLLHNHSKINYTDQISMVNRYMLSEALKSIENKPDILFLSLEEIASEMLCALLEADDEICHQFILNNHQKTFNYLYDVPTCWNDKKGSFLFWYELAQKLIPLTLKGDKLVNEKEDIEFFFNKDTILSLLKNKKIFPGVFVSLLLTNIMTNLPTIGGKRQGIYLKKMIHYVNSNSSLSTSDDINNVNWGIHPPINKYINENLGVVSALYLAANPPTNHQILEYLTNEEVLL